MRHNVVHYKGCLMMSPKKSNRIKGTLKNGSSPKLGDVKVTKKGVYRLTGTLVNRKNGAAQEGRWKRMDSGAGMSKKDRAVNKDSLDALASETEVNARDNDSVPEDLPLIKGYTHMDGVSIGLARPSNRNSSLNPGENFLNFDNLPPHLEAQLGRDKPEK